MTKLWCNLTPENIDFANENLAFTKENLVFARQNLGFAWGKLGFVKVRSTGGPDLLGTNPLKDLGRYGTARN